MKSTANTQLDLEAEESTDWQQLRATYQASLASNGLDFFLKTPEKAKPEEAPVELHPAERVRREAAAQAKRIRDEIASVQVTTHICKDSCCEFLM